MTAWGAGAEWILDRGPALVGLEDDPFALVTDHPLVSGLANRHRGYRFGATGLVVEAVMEAVVAQKVSGKEAKRSSRGLRRRFSSAAPGPHPLSLPPDPLQMAAAPYWDYHALGLEQGRAATLQRVAREAGRIAALADGDAAESRQWLSRIRGIGQWTTAETVAITHGDADAVSVGDYHHKHLVAWHLTGRPRGTDEEMLELLEPFRPHRGRVVRLLATRGWPPAFGPRMPIRSIETI